MIDFFVYSNDMLCLADQNGFFTLVNDAWTHTLGWSADELISRPYLEFVHPDDQAATLREAQLLATGDHETLWFENRYRCKDGQYRWLAWYVTAPQSVSGQLLGVARDITQQKEQAEALRITQERLQLVLDAANDAIWDWDLTSGTVWLNQKYNESFGTPPVQASAVEQWWLEHIHPEDQERVAASLRQAINGRDERWQSEYRYARFDGSYANVFDRAIILRNKQGEAVRVLGTFQDTTAWHQAREQLQAQTETIRHLFAINERERKLISHDIHDGLTQLLVGAAMQVEAARANPTECTSVLESAAQILSKAIAESRRLINDLRPIILDEGGVQESIEHLVADFYRILDCDFACEMHVPHRLDPLIEGVVFRIVQELLNNAVRHGQANSITIRIDHREDILRVEVSDNGNGFDLGRVAPSRFGLRGIRERARLFGGSVEIDTSPGRGTSVRVWLKVPSGTDRGAAG